MFEKVIKMFNLKDINKKITRLTNQKFSSSLFREWKLKISKVLFLFEDHWCNQALSFQNSIVYLEKETMFINIYVLTIFLIIFSNVLILFNVSFNLCDVIKQIFFINNLYWS